MHLGTFTTEGAWAGAGERISYLRELGVTVLEIMPIAEFTGKFGLGYDGVCLFAPSALYGELNEAKRFIDECHQAGLAVILDVVYNHLGPDGNWSIPAMAKSKRMRPGTIASPACSNAKAAAEESSRLRARRGELFGDFEIGLANRGPVASRLHPLQGCCLIVGGGLRC
jgi:hypothetical protein